MRLVDLEVQLADLDNQIKPDRHTRAKRLNP
jgi:hypothetical protein